MPKVSVIVPNYNHAPYLRQRIDSILNQTYHDFELILLDDCSTDNSCEIFESYKHNKHVSHIIANKSNSGSTFKQWDKGIGLAGGEWIWIAESDDWAEPEFLEKMMENIENNPSCGLIYCASRLVDSEGVTTFENKQNDGDLPKIWMGLDFVKSKLAYSNVIWNASMMMFRKNCSPDGEKKQLYEKMRYCGDWMFYILVALKSSVVCVPSVMNNFRQHDGNVSGKAERNGLAWLEGLDVLGFLLPKSHCKLNVMAHWCKNICRNKNKLQYPSDLIKDIEMKIKKTSLLMYMIYLPISIMYKIK